MYINPFIAGILVTIFAELVLLVSVAITNTFKGENKND